MSRSYLPNFFSALRIALMPAALLVAVGGSRPWFVGLVAVALMTDALDGFFARRLNAFSEFGRKLDSAGDYVTMLTGTAGIALLWPEHMRRELPWVIAGFAAFLAVVVYGAVGFGRLLTYHTWLAKFGTFGCAVSLIPLLADWAIAPFHAMITVQIAAAVEVVVISRLVPQHTGEMPTAWHAWRRRSEARR